MVPLRLVQVIFIIVFVFLYFEVFNYYLVIRQCSWPNLDYVKEKNDTVVKALLLADTHLLGPYRGHWFDKLRREWQMYRAFQASVYLYQPEVVFILGDLFDEGQWCNEAQFQEYVNRFFYLFNLPSTIKMYVVPGNHDIGFHYALYPRLVQKFEKVFNVTSVQLINIKQINFVLINSMAMEMDNCQFCRQAKNKIFKIAENLINNTCILKIKNKNCSRPIILQHFPMYRKSDSICQERDEAPAEIKNNPFREKWDCLSEQASNMIYDKLNPRLIITGHTHHGCHIIHRNDIHEYTLSSFSWRNKNNPTFMLAKFTANQFAVKKCDIPKESTVIYSYVCIGITTILWIILQQYLSRNEILYSTFIIF